MNEENSNIFGYDLEKNRYNVEKLDEHCKKLNNHTIALNFLNRIRRLCANEPKKTDGYEEMEQEIEYKETGIYTEPIPLVDQIDNLIIKYENKIKFDALGATKKQHQYQRHQKLRWLKSQALLVYLFDKLKENGMIAKSEHGHFYAVIKECFEKADGKEFTRNGLKATSTNTYNYTTKVGGGKIIDDILSTLITAENKSNQSI